MAVELKPETERLVQEEIQRGYFNSVDELIVQGIHALRENPTYSRRRQSLVRSSTIFSSRSELNLERVKDYPRRVDL